MKKILDELSKKIKKSFFYYVLGLILNKERKNCKAIARFFGMHHDSLLRFVSKTGLLIPLFPSLMISLAKHFSKKKLGWLIIDDTTISKTFARFIEGVFEIFNTAIGRNDRGLCIVVIAWSNGIVTIPLKFEWHHHKKIVGDQYKTKTELGIRLLLACAYKIKFRYVLLDAHYTTVKMMRFLVEQRIKFVGKFPKNRVIMTPDNTRAALKKHYALKLLRNNRSQKTTGLFVGMTLHFSCHKRQMKNGEYSYLYLVSNINVKGKEYLKMYEGRWFIETMFRTMKQSLGLSHCQCRDIDKQAVHIYSIFFGYSFLQKEKILNFFDKTEDAKRSLQGLKLEESISRINAFSGNFDYVA
jgi:hypothetical protein